MSIDFEHSVEIARPAEEVFAFVSDFENNPRWQQGMKTCRWTSDAHGVGGTYVQEASFLGRKIETAFVITEHVPGERVSIESTQSTFPIQVTRSVTALDANRCRVTAHVRGQPTGVLKLFGGMVKKSVAKDYARLKTLLEDE